MLPDKNLLSKLSLAFSRHVYKLDTDLQMVDSELYEIGIQLGIASWPSLMPGAAQCWTPTHAPQIIPVMNRLSMKQN